MLYANPNTSGAKIHFRAAYDNFIGGKFVPPVKGQYFDVITPITGKPFTKAARSGAEDIELALDAAHAAADNWGRTAAADRANALLKIADRLEQNLELLAYAETVDNGKPIRETLNADIPLAIDHFRYFAGCLRAQEGGLSQIDENTVAYHFHEPLGVVGLIVPWNFPILMAAWKLAPAIAAGNCVVLKPAESTPVSIMVMAELIADLLPRVCSISSTAMAAKQACPGQQQADRQDCIHGLHGHRAGHRAGCREQLDSGNAGAGRQESERLLRGHCVRRR
jgi:aldehyde dehydrogenase